MAPRQKRTPLSREEILRVALAVVDQDGLDALSMRRVGAALGVEAMSLYNHVPNKAALLDGLHERILDEMERPRVARNWVDHARHQARAFRRALSAHPNAVALFATRPAATPGSLARVEENLAVLRSAGFAPLHALNVVQSISAFVVGHTLWTVAPRPIGEATDISYESVSADEFPNVRAVAAALGRYDPQREFDHGLDAMLTGFRLVLESKTSH